MGDGKGKDILQRGNGLRKGTYDEQAKDGLKLF